MQSQEPAFPWDVAAVMQRNVKDIETFEMRKGVDTAPTVLIVDNELLIRVVVADYLRDCGFQVLETSNADEAQRILIAVPKVAVVVSDVQIPGSMDGFKLAAYVREHHPETEVVLASGIDAVSQAARDQSAESNGILLEKPYRLPDLEERIWILLRESEKQDRLQRHVPIGHVVANSSALASGAGA